MTEFTLNSEGITLEIRQNKEVRGEKEGTGDEQILIGDLTVPMMQFPAVK